MRFAYADPPYPGQARVHYSNDPLCAEVNHEELIRELGCYDGWALSTSSPALRLVLPLCPPNVRVAAWVKPFCSFKPGVNPAYAWEPVLYVPSPRKRSRTERTVKDFVSANITLQRGTHGVKPDAFSFWLFELLGAQFGDTFVDCFPGSGAVGRAWDAWRHAQLLDRDKEFGV